MQPDPEGPEAERPASSPEEIRDLARRYLGGTAGSEVAPTSPLTELEKLRHDDLRLMTRLREMYAKRVLWGLGIQVAVADLVFVLYAAIGAHWRISSATMDVWLAATVVQVVGIVLVVTRHLFPGAAADKAESVQKPGS